ncbi:hypothetical protein FHH43_09410 [Clostridium perfringens]|nr:hypothetical protein [Clostridium perfringens]
MLQTGIAKDHDLIVNEGALYLGSFSNITATDEFITSLNDKALGAFKDKLGIAAKPKVRQIKNAAGLEKGWQVIDEWEVKVTGTLLDFNSSLLETSLFKKVTEGQTTKYVANLGFIEESQYKDALIVGVGLDGKPVIVLVKDVLNKEGLGFELKGKDEAGFKISLENAYAGQKVNPVEVYPNFKEMEKIQAEKVQ